MTIAQNTNSSLGHWREIKGEIRKSWSKITDQELETVKGDINAIGVLIQKKYGESKTENAQKLKAIEERYEDKETNLIPIKPNNKSKK